MDSLLYSLNATVPIFAVIFISFLLRQRGFLSEGFVAGADKLTFRVLLPVLLFRDIACGDLTADFNGRFFLFCFFSTILIFLLIWGGAYFFLSDKRQVSAFTQGAFRSSIAILGVAFAVNIYGSAGMVPLMIVAIVPLFNIFSVLVLTVHNPQMMSGGASPLRLCLKGIVTNPIIIGIVAGLPFSLLQVQFPQMVLKTMDSFASMASPLALVVIGAGFNQAQALARIKPAVIASVIKLLVLPAVFLPIAYALGFRDEAMVALMIMLGSPTTVTSYIMAKNMGGDAALSSTIVVLTTAFSAITLTFFIYLARLTGAI